MLTVSALQTSHENNKNLMEKSSVSTSVRSEVVDCVLKCLCVDSKGLTDAEWPAIVSGVSEAQRERPNVTGCDQPLTQ